MFGGNGAFAGFCTTYYACLTILAGTCTNIAHGFPAGITAQLGKIGFRGFGALMIDAKLPSRALFTTADTDASLGDAAAFGTCRFELFGIDMFRTCLGL